MPFVAIGRRLPVLGLLAGVLAAFTLVQAPLVRGAETVIARPIQSYSALELKALPDSAQVVFLGKPITLGELRAREAARLKRFAGARALGRSFAASLSAVVSAVAAGSSASSKPAGVPVPLAKNLAPLGFTPAMDYVDFCSGSGATACLYLPAGATLFVTSFGNANATVFVDEDPLIQDPVCTAQSGYMYQSNCVFFYPSQFTANFSPGTIAGLPQFSANCSAGKYTSDVRGAIQETWANLSQNQIQTIGAQPQICLVTVYLPA
jgi:hypothetical protein